MFQLKQFWNRARRGVFFVLLLLLFVLLTILLNLCITALSLAISPLFVENGRR